MTYLAIWLDGFLAALGTPTLWLLLPMLLAQILADRYDEITSPEDTTDRDS